MSQQSKFFAREMELVELEEIYKRDGFKFVVVYGRRRVGKSTLLQNFLSNKPHISYMALEQNDQQNLAGFSEVILKRYDAAKGFLDKFETWEKAFDYIIKQAAEEHLVILIDEYPYLASSNYTISSILQKYADYDFTDTNITLILCGSSMSFMENQVLGAKSPLYGRRDKQLKIEPFDYYDSAKFFDTWNNVDKAYAYGVTSGIPLYLNKLKSWGSFAEGVRQEFLKKSGLLYEEPRNLLLQELREPAAYNAIIKSIALGASKLNDISTKAGEDSKKVSKYLLTLINLHLVKKELPAIGGQERNGIYKLSDNMFRFWYRFVINNRMNIELDMSEYVFDEKVIPQLSNYMGSVFEDMCIQYMLRKNALKKLPIVFDEIGRWWGNNPTLKKQEEIDFVASNGNVAIFGECKWKNSVGLEALNELIRKASLFSQFDNKYYFLFSKGEFSDSLIQTAKNNENIRLVNLDELYDI